MSPSKNRTKGKGLSRHRSVHVAGLGSPGSEQASAVDAAAHRVVQLSMDELTERLRLSSPELVDEIYAICVRAAASEDTRKAGIEAKAAGLLATVGVSMALISVFAGTAVHTASDILRWCFVLAMMFGLIAAACALAALQVTADYRSLNEADVFDQTTLDEAEAAVSSAGQSSGAGQAPEPDTRAAATLYKRFLAPSYWKIRCANFAVHERKATWLRRGQVLFGASLLAIAGLGLTLFFASAPVSRESAVKRPRESDTALDPEGLRVANVRAPVTATMATEQGVSR